MTGRASCLGLAVILAACAGHNDPNIGTVPARPEGSTQAAPPDVTSAVSYVEVRESGDERTIASSNGSLRGIDINSGVRIVVDELALASALAGPVQQNPEVARLQQQIDALRSAAAAIPSFVSMLNLAVEAWYVADRTQDFADVRALIRREAQLDRIITDTLRAAIERRLVATGMLASAAGADADAQRNSLRAFGSRSAYDWKRYNELLGNELSYLQTQMAARQPEPGLGIEIRVHRLGRDGPVAVPLPGYNTVMEGADQRFEKLPLAPDPAEVELYQKYDSLLSAVGNITLDARGLRLQLEAELGAGVAQVENALAAARDFVNTAQSQFTTLNRWAHGDVDAWLRQSTALLDAAGADGQKALNAIRGLRTSLDSSEVSEGLRALAALGSLSGTLAILPPPEALQRLLGTVNSLGNRKALGSLQADVWRTRAALATTLDSVVTVLAASANAQLRSALNAPNSPKTVLSGAVAQMRQAADQLAQASAPGIAFLRRLLQGTPQLLATDLPAPVGQRRVELGSGSADVTFHLRTIREGRSLGDRIHVSMRFFRGDQVLPQAIRDEFRIVSYGWNASFIASLAWVYLDNNSTFTASAAFSWIARSRSWPKKEDLGLRGSFPVGLGLTTMSLDFDSSQAVEVGLAPTFGFFGDRVLIGAGANLQASKSRWFGFFSLRVFGASGGLGGIH